LEPRRGGISGAHQPRLLKPFPDFAPQKLADLHMGEIGGQERHRVRPVRLAGEVGSPPAAGKLAALEAKPKAFHRNDAPLVRYRQG
jgi:hypothetical protein